MNIKFKKLLRMVFLFPILPIIGVDAGAGADGTGAGTGTGEGDKGGAGDKGGTGEPAKTHTQADVDKAVQDRVAREKKKYEKMIDDMKKQMTGDTGAGTGAGADGQPGAQGTDLNQEATQKAAAQIAVANQRLVAATAQTEAVKLGVDPKFVADVVRLADLSKVEVKEDGSMDTGVISKALDEVLKRVPVFKTTVDNAGGFKVGGEGTSAQKPAWGQQQNQQNQNQGQPQGMSKRWNRINH